MPIRAHFRWHPELEIKRNISSGDRFRISRLSTTCHGFTHVDAQAHFVADGPTIETTSLSRVVGRCRVFDMREVAPNTEIDAHRLAAADPGGPEGEILLLSVGWDGKRNYETPQFWTEAPWLNRGAAEWLRTRRPIAVAFDFPQDYPIRLLLEGKTVPKDQHVTHDVLLKSGVTLIEYLLNTTALKSCYILLSGPAVDPKCGRSPGAGLCD